MSISLFSWDRCLSPLPWFSVTAEVPFVGQVQNSSNNWKLWRPFQDNALNAQVMKHSGLRRKPMTLEHSAVYGPLSLSREKEAWQSVEQRRVTSQTRGAKLSCGHSVSVELDLQGGPDGGFYFQTG
ncbi:hypothetical protein HJG60_011685 [Phyllostomus discolor]|uniref:Uncharacterized protein n=1 Tax=Phyllostomus discolor TaxID=89673 RepID=A0A833ZUA6_9CHIR|nr:hypothetical protein HJG60_011685 [Phyllostomus discolor]